MARNTQKLGKLETHTLGREICQKPLLYVKKEKCTLQNLEHGKKTEKNMQNEKDKLQDMKYGKKH